MTRYLISFNDGAMDHIPDEDMPAVAKAAHAVVQEALNAGVYLALRRSGGSTNVPGLWSGWTERLRSAIGAVRRLASVAGEFRGEEPTWRAIPMQT